MSRECVVCLVDDSSFTVPVPTKSTLLGSELLDMAASHANIREKEYFGLYTEGDGFKNWLELDKPVLDPSQDLPKASQQIKIYFAFKYFVDDLRLLNDYMTVELLYLQSRQAIMKGDICTDDETIFELAACAMQSHFGEMRSEYEAKQQLNSFPIIPTHVFKRIAVSKCEECVSRYYSMMRSLSRGDAILKYLEIIQSLPMYSVHYFEVKDKKDVPLWLGVGPDGICQCPYSNRNDPDCRFQWLQLQNIYYRDKKFSMEVYQSSKPNKKGVGFGPVMVYAWHGPNSKVVMAIWKMARDQHIFYRSKRTKANLHMSMNMTEIVRQLNKLHRANISPCSSQSSLSQESSKCNQTQASAEAMAAAKAAQSEMYSALLVRRQTLMADFEKKAARYKDILVKEMQITGIPPEGLTAEEIEKMRKKFGVSFKFSKFVLDDSFGGGGDEVEQIEKQLEIQSSIIEASKTLLGQANNRKLKKDRKKAIRRMEDKYQELEQRLTDLKRCSRGSTMSGGTRFYGESPVSSPLYHSPSGTVPMPRRSTGTPAGASIDDNYLASMIFDTPPKQGGGGCGGVGCGVGANLQKSPHHKSTSALTDVQTTSSVMGKRGSTSSAPFGAPSHAASGVHQRRANTLAVTESSSYLSSIGGGGYADEFEDASPPSSGCSSTNTSFASNYSGNLYSAMGHAGYSTGGGGGSGGNLRTFDLTDEFLQHLSTGGTGGGSHSTSPSSCSGNNTVHSRVDMSTSSIPIPHFKHTSSPTMGFPTDNHHQFVVTHGEKGTSRQGHVTHTQDMNRSRSPDMQNRSTPYSSSYHTSGVEHANFNQYYQAQHSHGQQAAVYNQQLNVHGGKTSPVMYVQGHSTSSGGRDQSRYSGTGGSAHPHGAKTTPTNSQSRPTTGGQDSAPHRGSRKPSDQEIGILEALTMLDKSAEGKFDDGTLV